MKTILVLVSIVVFTALALGNYFNEITPQETNHEADVISAPPTCDKAAETTHPFIEITPEMLKKADLIYADLMAERREIEAYKAQHPELQEKQNNESDAKAFNRLAAENQRLYEQIQNSQ